MNFKHAIIGSFSLFIFGCGASQSNKDVKDPTRSISQTCPAQRTVLKFDGFCEEPQSVARLAHGGWKSWTVFKSSCNGTRYTSAGLGVVSVGWQGLTAGMDTIQLDKSWANKDFAYAIELIDSSGNSTVGDFLSAFVTVKTNPSRMFKHKMRFNQNGKFEIDYFGKNSTGGEALPDRPSQGTWIEPYSIIRPNRVNGAQSYSVNLLVKDLTNGNVIRLSGPILNSFTNRLTAGKPKTVGFFTVINPASKDSVWNILKSAKKCERSYERYRPVFNRISF